MNSFKVYGTKKNAPEMLTLGDERFDLFVAEVVDFVFSEDVKKRAKEVRQFGDNLILKIADIHDLIVMKCATDRVKDKDDVISIIKNVKVNFDIVIKEAMNQVKLGRERAAFDLGCFLEDMYRLDKNLVPMNVLDKLFDIVKKQAEIHKKNYKKTNNHS